MITQGQNNAYGRARILVIGLDAATFDVLDPLFAAEKCPNLARLKHEGVVATLQSTVPPLSPAAWVTTLTGCNPGQHGVFDFRALNLDKIHGRSDNLVYSDVYAGGTIFDYLSRQNMRVGAFNIPLTYPAWKVNGMMVAGPVTPDLRQAYTYPSTLAQRLGPMGHHARPQDLQRFAVDAYFNELAWSTRRHCAYGKQLLLEEGPFDLFWFHLHTLDSAQHRFWDDDAPETVYQLYEMADAGVGELLQLVGPESSVILLSDHGARARPAHTIRPNVWLQQQGWQIFPYDRGARRIFEAVRRRLQKQEPQPQLNLEQRVRWSLTQAYAFPLADPVGGIVINLQGRQPQGSVPQTEYETLRCQIAARLKTWQTLKGVPVMRQVNIREGVYHGKHTQNAPDIIFEVDPDFMIDGALDGHDMGSNAPLQPGEWKGVHAMQGVFMANGPHIDSASSLADLQLADITPTILYALGLPIPSNMDGRIREEIFTADFQQKHTPKLVPALHLGSQNHSNGNQKAENAQMLDRLRVLGYLE